MLWNHLSVKGVCTVLLILELESSEGRTGLGPTTTAKTITASQIIMLTLMQMFAQSTRQCHRFDKGMAQT